MVWARNFDYKTPLKKWNPTPGTDFRLKSRWDIFLMHPIQCTTYTKSLSFGQLQICGPYFGKHKYIWFIWYLSGGPYLGKVPWLPCTMASTYEWPYLFRWFRLLKTHPSHLLQRGEVASIQKHLKQHSNPCEGTHNHCVEKTGCRLPMENNFVAPVFIQHT